jgi:hypothetical protein
VTEYDKIFEDPMSVMLFNYITLGFIVAYAMAGVWMSANGKNVDLDALQPA